MHWIVLQGVNNMRPIPKDKMILRFDHYYINRDGDFVIMPIGGTKKSGYWFVASHANPCAFLGRIMMLSRIVPNDGTWTEIDETLFDITAGCHITGHAVKIPAHTGGDRPEIYKKY